MAGAVSTVIAASYGGAVVVRSRNRRKKQVNSIAQVESKAKLKLLGQIAAELDPVIVIPPAGNVTSRNLFIKKNYHLVYCNEDIAQLTYENLQLTGGMAGMPPIFVQREPSKGVRVRLAENMQGGIDRVVYILYRKSIEQKLVFVGSVIARAAGIDKLYPAQFPYIEGDIVIFAYGMKDVADSARTKYGNVEVKTAADVANLYLRHIKGKKDTIFTMTRGTTLFAGQSESEIVPEGYARVFVTPFGDGTVSGAGIFRIGDMVTISATPDDGYEFVGWMPNGSDIIISTDAQYSFVLTGQVDYVAQFRKGLYEFYVDMGLPSGTLWAKCNIDVRQPNGFAPTPFQYECSFFSWGNIDGHNPTSNNSFAPWNWGGVNSAEPWYQGQVYGSTPGSALQGDIPVSIEFDAARANLGTSWRLPTTNEYQELFANIIYINADGTEVDTTKEDKRVTVNGVVGIYLQSKINGARLFFACTGYGGGTTLNNRGTDGSYWTSTFDSSRNGRRLNFYYLGVYPQYSSSRYFGFPVRPVLKL